MNVPDKTWQTLYAMAMAIYMMGNQKKFHIASIFVNMPNICMHWILTSQNSLIKSLTPFAHW